MLSLSPLPSSSQSLWRRRSLCRIRDTRRLSSKGEGQFAGDDDDDDDDDGCGALLVVFSWSSVGFLFSSCCVERDGVMWSSRLLDWSVVGVECRAAKSARSSPSGKDGGQRRWRLGVEGSLCVSCFWSSSSSSSKEDRRLLREVRCGDCGGWGVYSLTLADGGVTGRCTESWFARVLGAVSAIGLASAGTSCGAFEEGICIGGEGRLVVRSDCSARQVLNMVVGKGEVGDWWVDGDEDDDDWGGDKTAIQGRREGRGCCIHGAQSSAEGKSIAGRVLRLCFLFYLFVSQFDLLPCL